MATSQFPIAIDTLKRVQDYPTSQATNVSRYEVLKEKTNLTTVEQDELQNLKSVLSSYMYEAEDINLQSDAIEKVQIFVKDNIDGYMQGKQIEMNNTISQFTDKGIWSNLTTYTQWNTVEYDDELYISKSNTNLNHTPIGGVTDLWWQKIAKRGVQGVPGLGLSWLGEYNNTYMYTVGNAVRYINNIYYNINSSIGNLPTNSVYWQIFLSSSGIVIQESAPLTPYLGMVWINAINMMNYWNGLQWVTLDAKNADTVDGKHASDLALQSDLDAHLADTTTAHDAVSAATASKIIIRDAVGRAKVVAPSAEDDIALKSNVTTVQDNLNAHTADTTTAHGAVSAATASKIIIRDAAGRAKVAAPSAVDDIARKDTVDAVQTNLNTHKTSADHDGRYATATQGTTADNALPKAGGTMSGEINCADQLLTSPRIKDYSESLGTTPATTGTVTLDLTTGNTFNITPTGAVTFVFSNPPVSGSVGSFTLIINQGATTYAAIWSTSITWLNDSIPDISTTSKTYILTFVTINGGTRWYGSLVGKFTT